MASEYRTQDRFVRPRKGYSLSIQRALDEAASRCVVTTMASPPESRAAMYSTDAIDWAIRYAADEITEEEARRVLATGYAYPE